MHTQHARQHSAQSTSTSSHHPLHSAGAARRAAVQATLLQQSPRERCSPQPLPSASTSVLSHHVPNLAELQKERRGMLRTGSRTFYSFHETDHQGPQAFPTDSLLGQKSEAKPSLGIWGLEPRLDQPLKESTLPSGSFSAGGLITAQAPSCALNSKGGQEVGNSLPWHTGAWPVPDQECRLHGVSLTLTLGHPWTMSTDHPPQSLSFLKGCSLGLRRPTHSGSCLPLIRPRWQSPKRCCVSSLCQEAEPLGAEPTLQGQKASKARPAAPSRGVW